MASSSITEETFTSSTASTTEPTLDEYQSYFKYLQDDSYPIDNLNKDNFDTECSSNKEAVESAWFIAVKNFNKKFDITRSYEENKHLENWRDQLKKDVISILWAMYREEYPSLSDLKANEPKYSGTSRGVHYEYLKRHNERIRAQYLEDRRRGAEKRYQKEQIERQRLGDDAFNKRMHTQKAVMYKKGPSTDENYLKFLEWRQKEQQNSNSTIFGSHYQNLSVKKAYTIRSKSMYVPPHTTTCMTRSDLMALMIEMLPKYHFKASLTENGFGNTSMSYIFSNGNPITPTPMNSTDRCKTKYGTVTHYIQHNGELYVCIGNEIKNAYFIFPKEFIGFTDYSDPVSGKFVGNPKKNAKYNLMNSFRGKIRVEITLRNVILDVDVVEGKDAQSLESVKKHISDLENPIGDIAERIRVKIKSRHDANKAEGERISKVVARKVKEKTSTVDPKGITEKLLQLSLLHNKGVLTDDEFTAAKAKAIAE